MMAMSIKPFVTSEYLSEVETARAYLAAVFDDGEIAEICSAVNDVAIALDHLDEDAGLSDEPTLNTFLKLLDLLKGRVSFSIEPKRTY
ncbi:DNA-binding protein [Asticcacaulis sp. W401b]|uniref:helix-turn-helix domain-containing transcriptional regulator n=1 Tax=Asticcacaulis sp. W401b TaxID=3388666 RepID=UPI00397102C6